MNRSTDRRATFIVNMQANRGRNVQRMRLLRDQIERTGETAWQITNGVGHATELARRAAEQGYERVIAVGGDGTLNEVVNGLMQLPLEKRPVLGAVPVGSGNDFVRGLTMTTGRTPVLEHLFNEDNAQPMDIPYVIIAGREKRYWCNALGIGFDAAVNMHSRRVKFLSGSLMYFVAVIRTLVQDFESPQMELEIDSTQSTSRVMMFTVGNGPREGGGFITTPAAQMNDGVLDYAVIGPVSRMLILRLIPEVMRGTHGRFKQVQLGRLQTLQVRSERPVLVHADGEMLSTYSEAVKTLQVGVIPHALRMVM